MKKLIAAALLASVAVLGTTAADARDGCGRGGFRGPHGRCHYAGDRRGPVVVAPGLVIGQRYDRGYWDGRRYWQNRYRHGGGWRYR
uniref:GCG_CRPN prefix-to-repeats domain-containing protein n=1 Tax=uncultured Sphingomonas sp. TaxID=158754 RepID=UPI0035CA7E56